MKYDILMKYTWPLGFLLRPKCVYLQGKVGINENSERPQNRAGRPQVFDVAYKTYPVVLVGSQFI